MNRSMRKDFFKFGRIVSAAWLFQSSVPFGGSALQQSAASSLNDKESSIKNFLQGYVGTKNEQKRATRYAHGFVDLNGDGKDEVIIYFIGSYWCGSGGCVSLILQAKDSSYAVVTKITITELPIRVMRRTSNGWRNISVMVRGGAMEPTYEAELCFDGKTYPSNPSVPPAQPLRTKVAGEVVIPRSAQVGVRLFP